MYTPKGYSGPGKEAHKFTSDEENAVAYYFEGSGDFNLWLQEGMKPEQHHKDLSAAINKQSLAADAKLYRGTQNFGGLVPGATITDAGFLSLTSDRKIAEEFASAGKRDGRVMVFHAPKGTHALDMNSVIDTEDTRNQKEFILQSGSTYVVDSIDANGDIHVRVVDPPSAARHTQLAEGGIVPGEGEGDTVPAMLEPGEVVIPKDEVDALRSKLAAAQSVLTNQNPLPGSGTLPAQPAKKGDGGAEAIKEFFDSAHGSIKNSWVDQHWDKLQAGDYRFGEMGNLEAKAVELHQAGKLPSKEGLDALYDEYGAWLRKKDADAAEKTSATQAKSPSLPEQSPASSANPLPESSPALKPKPNALPLTSGPKQAAKVGELTAKPLPASTASPTIEGGLKRGGAPVQAANPKRAEIEAAAEAEFQRKYAEMRAEAGRGPADWWERVAAAQAERAAQNALPDTLADAPEAANELPELGGDSEARPAGNAGASTGNEPRSLSVSWGSAVSLPGAGGALPAMATKRTPGRDDASLGETQSSSNAELIAAIKELTAMVKRLADIEDKKTGGPAAKGKAETKATPNPKALFEMLNGALNGGAKKKMPEDADGMVQALRFMGQVASRM